MLPNVDRSGKMGLFCSICCTTSHKVKQSGLVGKNTYVQGISHLFTLTSSLVLFMYCGKVFCLPGEEFSETSRRRFGEGGTLVSCRHLNTEMWCTLLFLRMQKAGVVLFCAGIAALLHGVPRTIPSRIGCGL